jgi:hypothetical protein
VTRETKFNLVFLAGFLLLCLPGVVILFIKKLDPDARSMAEASYVKRTEVYNNPLPIGSKTVRFVPPATFEWVNALALEHAGRPALRHAAAGGRLDPVMSEHRRFELLDLQEEGSGRVVVLLAWDGAFGQQWVTDLEATSEALGRFAGAEVLPVTLPGEVVAELKDSGLVIPPEKAGVIWLRFEPVAGQAPGAVEEVRVHLSWRTSDASAEDVLELSERLLERAGHAKDGAGSPGEGDDLPAVASDEAGQDAGSAAVTGANRRYQGE